ncbi:cation diffusion facilitator family transporter [Epilithonimonas xixisoli]|uniref:Cation diffusion facilitator family transporter n=1 Tax=Epilithonimonas xixisoli TaxID=1476462 RepID=A0A4R8IFG1_9FLAO|nr:cation diffusion facilitator family transporter [Epilithonimonas xixisoli]TDX84450.1 cation diffusion facilitator family transporter [Epilithonimonas xixisoli]
MEKNKQQNSNIAFQKWIAAVGIVLFVGKIFAWKITNSDSVFSDAMESIVNIISAFLGLYSLYLAAKPRDEDHPYGHGKVEFVTSAIEGALICIAGIMIIYEGSNSLISGKVLNKLDWGIWIIAATAIANYVLGYISIQKGKAENSIVLVSSGKHLQSDTITTLGVVVSLVLVYFTKIYWIDSVVALLFGIYIIVIGYKIIRRSLSGIMDEADPEMLKRLAKFLNENRKAEWIDIHNMKIQQFGSRLHIDAHLTLPWYFELRTAHNEMEEVIKLIAKNTDRKVEFNFHMDDCKPTSCAICQIENCPVRQFDFVKKVDWNGGNISQPDKHTLEN